MYHRQYAQPITPTIYLGTPPSPQETDGQEADKVHKQHDRVRQGVRSARVGGLVEEAGVRNDPSDYHRDEAEARHEQNLVPAVSGKTKAHAQSMNKCIEGGGGRDKFSLESM